MRSSRRGSGRATADILIVGAGATGGWAARQLALSGHSVTLLDAGAHLDVKREFDDSLRRRLLSASGAFTVTANAGVKSPESQRVQATSYAYDEFTAHLFVNDDDNPYEVPGDKPFTWIRSRVVGGRTTLWARVCMRMSDRQFKPTQAGEDAPDWPISYDDLAPYYDRVERYIGVHGIPEGHPEVPDGCYIPAPPLSANEREFAARVAQAGARALRRRFACLTRPGVSVASPKAMPHFCSAGSTIADALATSRLTLTPNCVVRRVLVDRGGKRAVGVEYVDSVSGRSGEAFGRVVMLCASALESTRIMLNSASKWHPHGLANSSGTLGRYLMDHVLGPRLVGAIERKAAARDVSGMAGLQIPGLGSTGARFVAQGAIELPFDSHGTACVFMGLGEMSPRAENCVSLSDTLTDKWGIPSLRIECAHDDRQQESCLAYLQGLRGLVTAAGYDVVNEGTKPELPGSAVHEMGTARMGSSSRESVLNEYCRTWDVDNLFITDGAAFVTSGFHNPTLTMLALTARACDKIHKDFAAEYV